LGSNGSSAFVYKQIANGGPITITHPDIIRYLFRGLPIGSRSGSDGYGGEIYIFDMGKPVKIIDLARKMIKLAGFIPDKDIMIKIVGLRGKNYTKNCLMTLQKTIPTYHDKIMIAQEIQDEYETLHTDIEDR
jgi:FlaA1/EpsC-like NDP-sugar epimerase